MEYRKHAKDLTKIASEAHDIVSIVSKAGPLRLVLLRGVPKEGIANWCLRFLDVCLDHVARPRPNIEPGHTIKDHCNRIQTSRPPRASLRQRLGHQKVIGFMPSSQRIV